MERNEERDPVEGVGGKMCPGMKAPLGVKFPLALRVLTLFTRGPLTMVGARHWPSHNVLSHVKGPQCHLHALANGLRFMVQF